MTKISSIEVLTMIEIDVVFVGFYGGCFPFEFPPFEFGEMLIERSLLESSTGTTRSVLPSTDFNVNRR